MLSPNWLSWLTKDFDYQRAARRRRPGRRRRLSILPLSLEHLEDRRLLAGEQIITVSPTSQAAEVSSPVSIDVRYSTSPKDETLTGLGLRVHFDSSKVSFSGFSNVFNTDKIGQDSAPSDDTNNFDINVDPDGITDKYISIAWADISGNWPGEGTTPLRLFRFNVTTTASFSGSTSINFSASSTASGYTLNAQSATITLNSPPTADAGGPYTVNEGSNVTLDGSGSTDPDNNITTYKWDFDNDGSYDDATGRNPTFNSKNSGTLTIGLEVTDAGGRKDTDTATITVNNVAPTADAGGPYSTIRNVAITLDGTDSTDPGDDIASYAWDLDDNGTFETAGDQVSFSSSSTGTFTVRLRVTDADGATNVDPAQITVNPPNAAPTLDPIPDPAPILEDSGQQTVGLSGISAGAGETQTITVTATSNNTTLIPNPTVVYTSPNSTGQLRYTPRAGEFGTATITVRVRDDGGTAGGGVDTVTRTFEVEVLAAGTNAAPSAVPDVYVLSQSSSSSATSTNGVLSNDTDPNGDALAAQLVSGATHGNLSLQSNGAFTYTPGSSFHGIDRFSYRAGDGLLNSSIVTVEVISYEASLVRKLYVQVLGRLPEDSGLEFWTDRIMNGGKYSDIAQGIFESDERLNPIIRQYYVDFLLRPAENEGLAYWRDQIWKRDGGPENVISGMIGSPEFFRSAGEANPGLSPNAAWVTELYRRLLTREPEEQGLEYWTDNLDQNRMTREQVVLGFVESDENFRNLVNGWLLQYLDRTATPSELTNYVNQMKNGASHRVIQIAIIDSVEYRNTPPPPSAGTVLRIA